MVWERCPIMSEVADFKIMEHPDREKIPMTANHSRAAADIKDFPSRVHGRPKIIMRASPLSVCLNPGKSIWTGNYLVYGKNATRIHSLIIFKYSHIGLAFFS
jgi:hypothetical protein